MMETRLHAQLNAAQPSSFTPILGGAPQRKCGCGGSAGTCSECDKGKESLSSQSGAQGLRLGNSRGVLHNAHHETPSSGQALDASTLRLMEPRMGHDFGKMRVRPGGSGLSSEANDQTPVQSGGLDEKFMETTEEAPAAEDGKDINLGEDETKAPPLPVIDSVEMVTSSTGAVGGFDQIQCLASLNQPGPYNDQAFRGSVANVHQVHFHLSQGYPGDLRATRMVNRTSLRRGQNFPKSGYDGPPDHEYLYTKDKMVIADAPGWCKTLQDGDFPVNYKADFSMYAWDAPTRSILASISYHVEIEKTYYSQPAPVNTVSVTATKIGGAVKSPVVPKK
ncbi:MAG TPA: hypothetical protein VEW46_02255 [Pyrinomonadaceae bacterium]|nr:hypothetical protein [Pyrinomonadaceae bacterium]